MRTRPMTTCECPDCRGTRINPCRESEEQTRLKELLETANLLLCSATPSKVLNAEKSEEWCSEFGKWFALVQGEVLNNPNAKLTHGVEETK